ncbi:Purine catabolism regulatory protein-like family [Synechococcus sp. PCC 7335]|uniref:PucR family transcriptional regulator n=1 Tax=Synechococcus sp. (strain ATCC 29403 / PCC 7335) TaxID=91464 RepID=UPI00017ED5E7|nr:PucR family transcriptional regulator [Synechococcus sp. PCC 7335]EDX84106.1 Purine catabolism regulatory protein-like family [Synechococcus sp. PCC 7335]
MLTVRKALNLPIFSSTRLVAGKKGLDNSINWVHTVDKTNAHYEWERQGVLLLTSGQGLYVEPKSQTMLISKLTQLGFSGLVLSTGHYFDRTPKIICQEANRLGFPIIEAPPDLLFIEITEAVLKRTVNDQYALLQQSAQINQQLTSLVLHGACLNGLAERLSALLQRSITIESPSFQILATAQASDVDSAWAHSLSIKRTAPEITAHLTKNKVYQQLIETSKPQRLPAVPALGMTMERMIAPIVVGEESYGYIWLISGVQPLTPLDELALNHGATVAALILVKEQAVQAVEDRLQGDFFSQLIASDRPSLSQLQALAKRFNYHLNYAHQVLVVRHSCIAPASLSSLRRSLQSQLSQSCFSFLLVALESHFAIVLEYHPEQSDRLISEKRGEALADKILSTLDQTAENLVVGVGSICMGEVEATKGLLESYEQAQEAAHISLLLCKRSQSVGVRYPRALAFKDLGLLHWIYHLTPAQRSANAYLQHVRTLVAHDRKRGTQLLDTLEIYLDHGCSISETAKALYVHRNTLLNRIKSIELLCQLDLRDAVQGFNLNAAVKSYRLHG